MFIFILTLESCVTTPCITANQIMPQCSQDQCICPQGYHYRNDAGCQIDKQTIKQIQSTTRPTITSYFPLSGINNQTTTFVITGSNFVAGTYAYLSLNSINCSQYSVNSLSSNTINISIFIPSSAIQGNWSVFVLNPDNQYSEAQSTFQVYSPVSLIQVQSLTPTQITTGQAATITIQGQGFQSIGIYNGPLGEEITEENSEEELLEQEYEVYFHDHFNIFEEDFYIWCNNLTIYSDSYLIAFFDFAYFYVDESFEFGDAPTVQYSLNIIQTNLSIIDYSNAFIVNPKYTLQVSSVQPSYGAIFSTSSYQISGQNLAVDKNIWFFLYAQNNPVIGAFSINIVNNTSASAVFTLQTPHGKQITIGQYMMYALDSTYQYIGVPFVVMELTPTVTSITPSYGAAGNSIQISQINGVNFLIGIDVTLNFNNINISATNIYISDSSQLSCTFIIPISVPAGKWNLITQNINSTIYNMSNAFTVTPPIPIVNSITPLFGETGSNVTIVILGNYFSSQMKTNLEYNSVALTIVNYSYINSSYASCIVQIPPTAQVGQYQFFVTNTYNESSTFMLFNITNPAPIIISILPNSVNTEQQISINISGAYFQQGVQVSLMQSGQNTVICTNVTLFSSNMFTCQLLFSDLESGQWMITVTNPDLQYAVSPNLFTVTSLSQTYMGIIIGSASIVLIITILIVVLIVTQRKKKQRMQAQPQQRKQPQVNVNLILGSDVTIQSNRTYNLCDDNVGPFNQDQNCQIDNVTQLTITNQDQQFNNIWNESALVKNRTDENNFCEKEQNENGNVQDAVPNAEGFV